MVMIPTASDLLAGCIKTLAAPVPPEDAGLFMTARLRTAALLNRMVALECAQGAAVRVAENAAIRALIAQAGPRYAVLAQEAAAIGDGDYAIETLDAANAKLRRLLIDLHEKAERAGDGVLDRKVLTFYRDMAVRRELALPPIRPA
jgi:hypothetical protein